MKRTSEQQVIEQFITDESNDFYAEGVTEVVYPESEDDVAQVLAEATASGTPVTVSGGGTGLTGGRCAVHGGIVMAMDHMRAPVVVDAEPVGIEHLGVDYTVALDAEHMLARCPVAITLEALDRLLAPELLFPPSPTEMSAMLGGAVACNASGARSFTWGKVNDWVEGLRIVLPDGDRLALRRGQVLADGRDFTVTTESGRELRFSAPSYRMPDVKNAAGLFARDGMDLVDLFVGCEGILGVITEVLVRVTQRPEFASDIAFFDTDEGALRHVDALRRAREHGLPAISIEYFDRNSLRFMQDQPYVEPHYRSAIFSELDVSDPDALEGLEAVFEESRPVDDWFADTEREMRAHRELRHSLPEGVNTYLRRRGSHKLCTDFATPRETFAEMFAAYHEAGERFKRAANRDGHFWVLFGHIGDWHLHVDYLIDTPEEFEVALREYAGLAQLAVRLGGTVTAEHGVGKKLMPLDGRRVPYLELMYGREGIEDIAATKRALDPALILNPGNMVPREYL
ncbi:MAG: FAD-binding oxidoreductase [Armatimonadetes bacterium]|nr:FAD-binding oxidoreductase [Armatimonadota bacterium]